jgi:hypothetical protein
VVLRSAFHPLRTFRGELFVPRRRPKDPGALGTRRRAASDALSAAAPA